mmetsp:Transcript_22616/g.51826  ORF Transcript_22616/g.51826 Transcript_22616/m.51826 type:complete len:698 (-) Transcript_22616:226-2319(-)
MALTTQRRPHKVHQEQLSPDVDRCGRYRHKNKLRAVFRSISFVGLVTIYWAFGDTFRGDEHVFSNGDLDHTHRRLGVQIDASLSGLEGSAVVDDCVTVANPIWHLAPLIFGVLYMFVSLAIVCDEFFVPALEEMAGPKHLNLSLDIAGATLMAAGGSAPELFTSFFGTFRGSAVGFGTIIGSATFNVLFVIGVCALNAPRPLDLTWWPLLRDCIYYATGLFVLAYVFQWSSAGVIEIWEAGTLLGMYFGYVLLMYFNMDLYKFILTKVLRKEMTPDDPNFKDNISFYNPSMFRLGIVHTLSMGGRSLVDSAGIGIVTRIRGDVHDVFAEIDKDKNGYIDVAELHEMFRRLDCQMTDEEVEDAMQELDKDDDNRISEDEFAKWYMASEHRIHSEIENVFKEIDEDKDGKIRIEEIAHIFNEVQYHITRAELEEAMCELSACAANEEDPGEVPDSITFATFQEWYDKSLFWTAKKKEGEELAEESDVSLWDSIVPPKNDAATFLGYCRWIFLLPVVLVLYFTIPDVRKAGWGKFCYVAFMLSICWIGIFSNFMVAWTETIGNTFGIPAMIMGLTFLAAGTSVPDLLSSVVVAKKGYGDMAVSSSIGSNIFDILVGLPLPWLVYCLWPNGESTIVVKADNVVMNILILLGMLLAVIGSIMIAGWKMTKVLGWLMFLFYFLYVVQAIFFGLPFGEVTPCAR